jgi:beta-lactamase regulating signal transducer with metallopeptidase domain/type II secretory pathway component GspD/PulD (secretin)
VLPVVTIQLIQGPASYSTVRAESASALSPQVEAEEIVLLKPLAPIQAPAIPLKLRAVALLEPALPYIVAAWLLGVLTLSVWHLGGWAHLQRLKRRIVKEADAALIETLGALAAKLKVTRPVQLAESALVQIPAVVGWLRPVILLPAAAVTGLTTQQLEALLAHELAHIRRYDYLVNMLQTIVEILGFYHPAVWWISHKIRVERENCCDDLAVNVCGDKMRYARALAEMERIRSSQPEFALAANGGNLFTRICRLIGKGSAPKPRFNWAAALIAALLILALAIPTTLAISRRRSTGTDDNTAAARAPDANNIPPAPPVYVTDANETRLQTLFEFKIFQVAKDSKLIKDADNGNVFVRCDKAFADELKTLSKESKDARVLTAPRVITLEGEEAVMFVGNDMPYTAGYTEQPGKGPKPIMKTVHGGYKIRVKAEVVDNTSIRTDFIFTQTDPTFTTHKVARDQEIQIPVIKTTECSAVVTTGDGATIFIGGLQDAEKPNQTIIIQLTPHIIRAGRTAPADDSLPNKGSNEEISFTVAPQVVTSIRVDTLDAQALPSSRPEPVRVVEELIAMLKGQAPLSFELLNTQMAVAEQLKDLRTILAEQPVEIKPVLADDKEALVTTTTVKDDRNREGQLLFRLTKQQSKWIIDDIDFETPDTLEEELARFQKRSEASKGSRRRPADNNSQATEDRSILIFKLRYADCREASDMLRPLLVDMQGVTIVPDTNSNLLIINNATRADFKRIGDLIQKIDLAEIGRAQSGPSDIVVDIFPLEYADCEQVALLLNDLPTLREKAKIVADSRMNQVIVQASEAEIEQISNLIRQLDQPIDKEAAEERQAQKPEELKILEDQRKQLADKLKALQQKIRQLQREHGMAELTTRQDLMLQRVAGLMNELTKTESRRMQLETDLRLLEQDKDQPLPPQEMLKMRQEYVNNDATVRALAGKAAQVEMELLLARQTSTNDSPEVKSKANLLEALKARLEQAKQEVAATFDNLMAKQAAETYRQKLIKAQTELEQNRSYEDRLRERLKDEDAETVRIAQIQQEIQLLRDESDSIREMYDEIGRRVMGLQTGLTSPARPDISNAPPRNSAIEAPPPELKPIPPANQDK